jgi:hypothetical protein
MLDAATTTGDNAHHAATKKPTDVRRQFLEEIKENIVDLPEYGVAAFYR